MPLLDVRHCSKLWLYAISRKTNDLNSRKWKKNSFWAWFRTVGSKFGPQIFFFFSKIYLLQSLDILVSYHHVQYQKKLIIQSSENLVTDGRTEGQTYESDLIGCCPTNVERPKIEISREQKQLLRQNKK